MMKARTASGPGLHLWVHQVIELGLTTPAERPMTVSEGQ